jgi:hypothetical protein
MKKISVLAMMFMLVGANSALALDSLPFTPADATTAPQAVTTAAPINYDAIQPIYLEVVWGNMEAQNTAPQNQTFDMTIEHGGITVAKDILITPEEIMTNSAKDVGVPSPNLHIETKANADFQGAIVKIFPDPSVDANFNNVTFQVGGVAAKTSLGQATVAQLSKNYNVSLNEQTESNDTQTASNTVLALRTIHYKPELSVKDASTLFARKLNVIKRMIGVEKWMRGLYQQGKVSQSALLNSRKTFEMALLKDYSEADTALALPRINRLFYSVNNKNLPPELFLAGLKRALVK